MSGKKPRWRKGVSEASKRTSPRDSSHCRGTGAMLDPAAAAFLVRAGNEGRVRVPVRSRRRPHRLRLGPDDRDRAIALELLTVAAVDQAPVGPGLGDDRLEIAHAASASFAPTDATATRPVEQALRPRLARPRRRPRGSARAARRATGSARTPRSSAPSDRRGPAAFPGSSAARLRSAPGRGRARLRSGSSAVVAEHSRARAAPIRPPARRSAAQPIADQAGIGKGLAPGVDRISEAALLAQLLEQPRRRSAAERLDEQGQRGHRAGRAAGKPAKREAPVRLLEAAAVVADAAGEVRRLDCRRVGAAAMSPNRRSASFEHLRPDRPCRSPPAPAATGTNCVASQSRQSCRRDRAQRSASVPSTGRPSGWPSNAASNR